MGIQGLRTEETRKDPSPISSEIQEHREERAGVVPWREGAVRGGIARGTQKDSTGGAEEMGWLAPLMIFSRCLFGRTRAEVARKGGTNTQTLRTKRVSLVGAAGWQKLVGVQ